MSAPIAEAKSAPSGGALIGIALGLMVLAGLAAYLLLGTGGPIEGREKMTSVFGVADLPFGFEIASATRMSSAGTLVVYEVPGAPAEPARVAVTAAADVADAPRTDWAKLAIPETSEPPRQASFLFVPRDAGRGVLEGMIREVRGADRGQLGGEGGTVLVERGRLDYRGWDSDWIHLRTFEPGGTFRDAMRISLSTPDAPCVLTATWSRGTPASRAKLDELIAPLLATAR